MNQSGEIVNIGAQDLAETKALVQQMANQIATLTNQLSDVKNKLSNVEETSRDIRQLVGPFGVPFQDGTVLVQTLYGTKYFIEANDFVMMPQMIIYRQWETELSHFFLAHTSDSTVFVDVGANIGYFTCLVASKIGAGGRGRVFAIEPNPRVFELLERNAAVNWSMAPIALFRCGASDATGNATLFVPASGAANASMAAIPGSKTLVEHTIELKRLDDIVPADLAVDLMKIDVEGFELFVLKGGVDVIKRSPSMIIVMEWSLAQIGRAGWSPDDFFDFALKAGLGFFNVPTENTKNVNWDAYAVDSATLRATPYTNIILRRIRA